MRPIDIGVGTRFGRLIVLDLVKQNVPSERSYRCMCDCGNVIVTLSSSLRKGRTKSCGCLRIDSDLVRHNTAVIGVRERFYKHVDARSADECWPWIGYRDRRGYGRFRIPGERNMKVASRVSYELKYGDIPDGMCVCHKCDNPQCVNPSHFFIGTKADNNKDMYEKGRDKHARGEKAGRSKLTSNDVETIRTSKKSLRSIALEFGITYGHAGKIRRGELWA